MPLRHRHQFNQGVRPMNLKGSIGRSCRKLTDNPTIFRDKLDTFFMTGEQFEVARADTALPTGFSVLSPPTQFSPRAKWWHLLHAKMSQIGTCLYARLVFHLLIFSISTV